MRDAHNTGLIYLGVRGIQKIGNPWDRVWIITIDCKKNYNLEGLALAFLTFLKDHLFIVSEVRIMF